MYTHIYKHMYTHMHIRDDMILEGDKSPCLSNRSKISVLVISSRLDKIPGTQKIKESCFYVNRQKRIAGQNRATIMVGKIRWWVMARMEAV